ncbi:hypothetical protein ACIP98_19430 [Streptomyces sp. NPDC088354]|uniref:hypothetical protein n=1 Tax=unclassified Streptomyces TaxID=2593676 RepID=UPI0029A53949|nr:hypothetical protein [Streptomyces sp. MI02-7b]MDX3078305.1 hypothetical protein [Streptomyces sp. MI02-7b]
MRKLARAAATTALAAVAVIVPLTGTAQAAPSHAVTGGWDEGGYGRGGFDRGHHGGRCGEHRGGVRLWTYYRWSNHWGHGRGWDDRGGDRFGFGRDRFEFGRDGRDCGCSYAFRGGRF